MLFVVSKNILEMSLGEKKNESRVVVKVETGGVGFWFSSWRTPSGKM